MTRSILRYLFWTVAAVGWGLIIGAWLLGLSRARW